jgi:hypothetical protein
MVTKVVLSSYFLHCLFFATAYSLHLHSSKHTLHCCKYSSMFSWSCLVSQISLFDITAKAHARELPTCESAHLSFSESWIGQGERTRYKWPSMPKPHCELLENWDRSIYWWDSLWGKYNKKLSIIVFLHLRLKLILNFNRVIRFKTAVPSLMLSRVIIASPWSNVQRGNRRHKAVTIVHSIKWCLAGSLVWRCKIK